MELGGFPLLFFSCMVVLIAFLLLFLAELFLVFSFRQFFLWILLIHLLSFLVGLHLTRRFPIEELARFFAYKNNKEHLVREYLDEIAITLAIVFLMIPGLLFHGVGFLLFIPKIRHSWLFGSFFPPSL